MSSSGVKPTIVGAAGFTSSIVMVTAPATANVGDFIEADASAGGFDVKLPTNARVGALVTVKKIDTSANIVRVLPQNSGGNSPTIDGDPYARIVSPGFGAVFEHVGADVWRIMAATMSSGANGANGLNGVVSAVQAAGVPVTARPTINLSGTGTAVTDDAANNRTNIVVSAGASGPLAYVAYGPGSYTALATNSAAFADVDATNAKVTFTAPTSGAVVVRVWCRLKTPNTAGALLNLRDAGGDIAGTAILSGFASASNAFYVATAVIRVTGLTPGNVYTWKLGWASGNAGTTVNLEYAAGSIPIIMEVWSG